MYWFLMFVKSGSEMQVRDEDPIVVIYSCLILIRYQYLGAAREVFDRIDYEAVGLP